MSRSRSILRSPALRSSYQRRASLRGAALLALFAPIAFGSCAADSVSLRITCNVAPEGDCTYQASGLCQSDGALNVSYARNYWATLRVSNGLKPRDRDVPVQSEPNGVLVYELEIELADSSGKKISFGSGVPNPYTVPATGFVEPGEDGLVGATLIPVAYVRRIISMSNNSGMSQVRLNVLARGRSSGDVEVESGNWNWTVELYANNLDWRADARSCTTTEEDVCTLGQDQFVAVCDPNTVDE